MIKNIIAAFHFLTILPLPVKTAQKHLEKSIPWYPLVGAVIGLIIGYGYKLLENLFSPGISSALTLLLYIILTRGLHLDGFMDTIDGFFSHTAKSDGNSRLKIMKDPAVGSFALLGAIIWSLLLSNAIPDLDLLDFVSIHMLARWAILPIPLIFSYPRESGTGKFFAENINLKTLFAAILITLVIMGVVFFLHNDERITILLIWGALTFMTFLIATGIGWWSKHKINGVTGDVLGFTIEVLHVVLALLISQVISKW